MVSDSAQALFLSLMTQQVTPWQSVCQSPVSLGEHWQSVSFTLFSAVLQPMWWCCRGPIPMVSRRKNSLYWMTTLVQDPTPAAGLLWLPAVRLRIPALCVSAGQPAEDMDSFLLRCFWDFASADELYKKGG